MITKKIIHLFWRWYY